MSTLKNGPIRIVEKDTCLNCWNITTGNKITKTPNYVLNCAPVAARGRRVLDEGVDWHFLLFRLLSDVTGDELALHCTEGSSDKLYMDHNLANLSRIQLQIWSNVAQI